MNVCAQIVNGKNPRKLWSSKKIQYNMCTWEKSIDSLVGLYMTNSGRHISEYTAFQLEIMWNPIGFLFRMVIKFSMNKTNEVIFSLWNKDKRESKSGLLLLLLLFVVVVLVLCEVNGCVSSGCHLICFTVLVRRIYKNINKYGNIKPHAMVFVNILHFFLFFSHLLSVVVIAINYTWMHYQITVVEQTETVFFEDIWK